MREIIKKILRESEFDWIESEPIGSMNRCEAVEHLEVGDRVILDVDSWPWSSGTNSAIDAEATILEKDQCNKIQPSNHSRNMTLLFHVDNKPYDGFDWSWVNKFKSERSKEICGDGRCYFIMCDTETSRVRNIRPIGRINEQEDFEWISDTDRWENIVEVIKILEPGEYKVWLGEVPETEYKQFQKHIRTQNDEEPFSILGLSGGDIIIDSIYIKIPRNKKHESSIISWMGCKKRTTWSRDTKDSICEDRDGVQRIKPSRLEFDKKYFDRSRATELRL